MPAKICGSTNVPPTHSVALVIVTITTEIGSMVYAKIMTVRQAGLNLKVSIINVTLH